MYIATNSFPTEEFQRLNAAHHVQPFSANNALGKKGSRIIADAKGVFITDTEGNQLLDGMAGLWCVNIGYGRKELVDVAARQMAELPYYLSLIHI